MPDPVFDNTDRVADNKPPQDDGLPAELRGKSPSEIFAYMNNREAALRQENESLRRVKPAERKPAENPNPVTDAEFFNKPTESASRLIDEKLTSRLDTIIAGAQDPLSYAAKMQVKDKHKDFSRFEGEIDSVMNKLEPLQRTQPGMWETVYFQVKGLRADQLINEAATRAAAPASEVPSPAAAAAEIPKTLTNEEKQVANGLGVTDKKYLETKERMRTGLWPMTLSNTGR